MESFFHTLKTEPVHNRVYATRDHARRDLFDISRASIIPAACIQHRAISVHPMLNVEQANPVDFFEEDHLVSSLIR